MVSVLTPPDANVSNEYASPRELNAREMAVMLASPRENHLPSDNLSKAAVCSCSTHWGEHQQMVRSPPAPPPPRLPDHTEAMRLNAIRLSVSAICTTHGVNLGGG